jgi:L-lactate dehydrogenase complex protein LldF
LRKEQVGELFHEKLGIPYTTDIPTLTAAARKVLREVFLTADIGLSGVNFSVAETGALCIITNEGNGRMVTTMPKVHIALMGMERIVPNLDGLALMLSLLPRSATGQKLTVYTKLLNQPLAGQTRHLIILDNGRTRLRNSPLKESLYCIRCGACLNACPVFRELSGHAYIGTDGSIAPYPGPIGSIVSPGLLGENFVQLAQASSLCGACKDACPVDIDLPKLLTRVRAGQSEMKEEKRKRVLDFRTQQNLFCRYTARRAQPEAVRCVTKIRGAGKLSLGTALTLDASPCHHCLGLQQGFSALCRKTFRERWHKNDVTLSEAKGLVNHTGDSSGTVSRPMTWIELPNSRTN